MVAQHLRLVLDILITIIAAMVIFRIRQLLQRYTVKSRYLNRSLWLAFCTMAPLDLDHLDDIECTTRRHVNDHDITIYDPRVMR